MPITIRTATEMDAAALASVAAVTFPLACPPHTSDDAKAAYIAEWLSEQRFAEYTRDPDRAVLLAELAGEPVGYTMLVFGEPHDADAAAAVAIRPTSELSKCYVLPGHHGAGVAAALMTGSLRTARERGAAGIWLGVNEQNGRAQAFYAKHGFELVGTKHFTVGGRIEDDYVLARGL
jgi:GNAT superfamily N-acetyltransferase